MMKRTIKRKLPFWIVLIGTVVTITIMPWGWQQLRAQQPVADVLRVYNWDTYIDPEVLTTFQEKYNVEIVYQTYGSNEELYSRIQTGNTNYDLIFPTDYMVEAMANEGLLAELNLQHIPNLRHLDPAFLNPTYDPGNRYSLPYQWGTLGIGYNLEVIGQEIDSWTDMFTPQYAGKIAWMDDTRYTIGAVLMFLGYDPNTQDMQQINQARDFLIQQKATIAAFAPDTGQNLLNQGEVDLAFEWNGDMLQVMQENPDLRYTIPKEGSIIWIDNMAIPRGAPHQRLAEQFINFLLEPRVSARISNFVRYGSPNQTARESELINPSDLNNPSIYPPLNIFAHLQSLKDVGNSRLLYEQAWKAVKTKISELEQNIP